MFGRVVAVACGVVAMAGIGGASAADVAWGTRDSTISQPLYHPERWEVRASGYAHCCFVERGAAIGGAIVAPRLFLIPHLPELFSPRIMVGGNASLQGHTSYGFASLLFTWNVTRRFFLEPFVGVAVSNGVSAGDATHNAIGCTTLIHSGGNIGYRVDDRWSVMLTLDHVSNGNLCSRNVGVNNYGAKVGYSF